MEALRGFARDWNSMRVYLFMLGLLWIPTFYISAWLWPDANWVNYVQYSSESDLKNATVSIAPRPHDCDFFAAPMGSKHCHYNKHLRAVRVRTLSSGGFVSTDEGRTWTKAKPSDHAAVFISWEKVYDW